MQREIHRDGFTEQDAACAQIGWNSVECGAHESDMIRRYPEIYWPEMLEPSTSE